MLRIGSIIQQERKSLQITQETLAAHCQVSKASVSKWEKGQSYPDITLLPKLAAYFNMTVDELLGHEQTLSKEDIQKRYIEFSKRFGSEPFYSVFADVELVVKHGFCDAGLLLQMSILMLNHYELATESTDILKTTNTWLERIRHLSEDIWILRQVNSLQATISTMQANPEKTLQLLDGVIRPSIGDEVLLATAHEQVGNTTEAKRVIQVMMYQNSIQLVGATPIYLRLLVNDTEQFNETLHRTEGLIHLFNLERLHPNICIQFYISVAQLAALSQNRTLLYTYLKSFVNTCTKYLFPIQLHGDQYFNLLDEWLNQLDLGTNALRSEELVKQSIMDLMSSPIFAAYKQDEEMVSLQQKLRFGLER